MVDLDEDQAEASGKKWSKTVVAFALPEGDGEESVDEDGDEDEDEDAGDQGEEDGIDHFAAEAEMIPTSTGNDENSDGDGNADENGGNVDEDEDADDPEDDDSEVELPSDLSDEDDEPDHLDGLDAFVDQLASADKKRKTTIEGINDTATKKRRVLPVISGPGLTDSGALGLRNSE